MSDFALLKKKKELRRVKYSRIDRIIEKQINNEKEKTKKMFEKLKENNLVNYAFHLEMVEKIKTIGFQNKEIENNYEVFY